MKKENVTINASKEDYNRLIENTIYLKNSIENEINEINNLYDKIFEEITKSFIKRHEQLVNQEKELKDELQNKVTQEKEKLENFLSESNRIINMREKINNKIKNVENEKNTIKVLSYISKIDSYKKEANDFLGKKMKNIKINFQEEETKINYQEYIFNWMSIQKEIQIKEITSKSAKLILNIDDTNIIDKVKNECKYKIEIRKESKNEKFKTIYEGGNKEYLIDKLSHDNTYEVRVCLLYEDIMSSWSEIQKFKTKKIDSIIIAESKREDELLKKMIDWCGSNNFELLYRGTRDGPTSDAFHNKCDNQKPTICLYKNEIGNIFGGYTSIEWTKNKGTCSDSKSFIFTLTNIYDIEPTKFSSKSSKNVHHAADYGPSFGEYSSDISVYGNFIEKKSSSNFPEQYNDSTGKGKSIFTGNPDKKEFKIEEIEVFRINENN